ncbi:MAG: hypothetical protein ACWA44_12545 [Thiotrichales bacterium]
MYLKSTIRFALAISAITQIVSFALYPLQASPASDKRVEFGIEALKQGDYDTASQWLLSARQRGSKHPDLTLALGLSSYYSGNLGEAADYLLTATTGEHRYEAAYYLGEIKRDQGELSTAQSWYEIAAGQYEDIEIQKAADNALLRLRLLNLTNETLIENGDTLERYALVSLESSYTAGLTDPEDSSDADAKDTSTAILAAGGLALPLGKNPLKWLAGASYYAENYSDFSAYDVSALSIHTGISNQFSANKVLARAGYTQFKLAGAPYLNQSELRLQNRYRLSRELELVTTGKLIDINSPTSAYAHSAGELFGISAKLQGNSDLKWRLSISAQRENRGSQSVNIAIPATGEYVTTHTSYSRDWVKLSGKLSWPLKTKWRQSLAASWRSAFYQDSESYLANADDEDLSEQQRKVQRLTLKTELSRRLTNQLEATLGYQYLNDDANIDFYDFNSHTISMGITAMFQ